ncbi:hypothetical protein ACHAXT_002024 [Thalassiosira profunda]
MAALGGGGGGSDGDPAPLHHALSLPSIDELDVHRLLLPGSNGNNATANNRARSARSTPTSSPFLGRNRRRHRRAATDGHVRKASRVTTKKASPTNSLHSTLGGATNGANSAAAQRTGTFPTTQLLQNMMRSHRNRDPYNDYLVLGLIGKGSIGSVEKVVRRHRSVVARGIDEGNGGGIFSCCAASDYGDGMERPCWGLFAKLFGHKGANAFQSAGLQTPSDSLNTSQSVVSETSAFSAPPSPTPGMVSPASQQLHEHQSTSHRLEGDNGLSLSNHTIGPSSMHRYFSTRRHSPGQQHPLRKYALKSIRLDRADGAGISSGDAAELRNEISILRSLDHPNIVHIIEVFEWRKRIYMVIDLCENGDLYVLDPYSEGEAKVIIRQLLRAVSYMHHRGIVHRDLKYENVMFSDRGSGRSKLEIKLIDFGLSKKYRARGQLDMASMTDFVGTIYTMAPEVIRGDYTFKCDVWSLGVMSYMLLSSQLPFCGRDMKEIARKIMFADHSFSGKRWAKISRRGREFVSSLLVRDAEARPTADRALKHPWLVGGGAPSFDATTLHRRHSSETVGGTVFSLMKMPPQAPLDSQICASIENYSTYSWLHRLALMVIAYRYTGEETTHLRRIYLSYDVDNSGTVEVEELRDAFALHDKYTGSEIDQIFLAVDMNGSGKISWTEFLAATIETKGLISEDEFASAFDHLDCDKSGFISTSNLREIIGRDLPESVIDQIIDESDLIGDHRIWKDEFMALSQESASAMDSEADHHRQRDALYLKRSKSADDFDLVKTRSDLYAGEEEEEEDTGSFMFRAEKAKSARRAQAV